MKKACLAVMTILALVTMPVANIWAEAGDGGDSDDLFIARVSAKDGEEYVELKNKSDEEININNLVIQIFGKGEKPKYEAEFKDGKILPNGSVIIGEIKNADNSYESKNNIPKSGGYVNLLIDNKIASSICWGSIECSNRVISLEDTEILINDCLLNTECGSINKFSKVNRSDNSELGFGGWQQNLPEFEPCEFDATISKDDAECQPPIAQDPENQINPEIQPNPTLPEETPNFCVNIKITEILANVGDNEKFVEIFNPTNAEINLAGCQIITYNEKGKDLGVYVFGEGEILAVGQYRALKNTKETPLKINKTTGGMVCILSSDDTEEDCVGYGRLKESSSWAFISDSWQETTEITEGAKNPQPKPMNSCEGLKINEIGANLDEQFIELINSSTQEINLSGCRLLTNRSMTKFYEFGDENLSPNALKIIKIADTDLTLTKTTTGAVYLLTSDGQDEIDSVQYENLAKNTSWSLIDGEWMQTYAVTWGGVNNMQQFPTCQAGYFRNFETGLCNKNPEPEILKPCAEGQYRSAETGRCRKLESATTTILTPCQEGYERNPLTNRCRKIATTAENEPKPCAEGYERNPETGRCRKKTSSAPAGFAVKANSSNGDGSWKMVAGGVLGATILIIIFQYRAEIRRLCRKLLRRDKEMEAI